MGEFGPADRSGRSFPVAPPLCQLLTSFPLGRRKSERRLDADSVPMSAKTFSAENFSLLVHTVTAAASLCEFELLSRLLNITSARFEFNIIKAPRNGSAGDVNASKSLAASQRTCLRIRLTLSNIAAVVCWCAALGALRSIQQRIFRRFVYKLQLFGLSKTHGGEGEEEKSKNR